MASTVASLASKPDISRPRWDQATYTGRAKHFLTTVNPLNLFVSSKKLEESRTIVQNYRKHIYDPNLTVDELWKAKTIFDSAYHPETGEKMFILGRMSAQVPCNMTIVGGMLAFNQKFAHVLFFQWLNQSFNAIVNYTNRSGKDASSNRRLFMSYCAATSGAIAVALSANKVITKMKGVPNVLRNFVPFIAVAAANAINIPMMRSQEFTDGIRIEDAHGREMGYSVNVAYRAIPEVLISRIGMAIPHMVLGPVIVMNIAKRKFYKPWMLAPIQILLCGIMLSFSTPLCCALFPQKSSISVSSLESSVREKIAKLPNPPSVVYFNKGL